jgi:hypothetical protein
MCCYIYFLRIAWFMQPAMKAQEQEQAQPAGGRRRRRQMAEMKR